MTECERPQFRPGRSYSAEAIIRLTAGSSPAHRASSTFPPGLWVPLSLHASLPLSVFVSPSGLPDVPGYMALSSLVEGTKARTRKEVRGEIKGWRWKRRFTAIGELHKQSGQIWRHLEWYGMSRFPAAAVWRRWWSGNDRTLCGFTKEILFVAADFFFPHLSVLHPKPESSHDFLWPSTQQIEPNYSTAENHTNAVAQEASLTWPPCGNVLSVTLAEVKSDKILKQQKKKSFKNILKTQNDQLKFALPSTVSSSNLMKERTNSQTLNLQKTTKVRQKGNTVSLVNQQLHLSSYIILR